MIRVLKDETPKDKVINDIIAEEWEMFGQVQNIDGRAACQDDGRTFYIMRYGQFSVLSEPTLQSYLSDLRVSKNIGINMLALKYAYMMRITDFAYYDDHLRKNVPPITSEKREVVDQIVAKLDEYQKAFAAKYPKYASHQRTTAEGVNETSISAYATGELETYSITTLKLLKKDVEADPDILEKMQTEVAKLSGYSSLSAAESAL
ncbi:MAG: DUF4125 family protein [Anaerovoracaceae bacterium]|jgi:hypothetical protein